jgi:hypothetical protein
VIPASAVNGCARIGTKWTTRWSQIAKLVTQTECRAKLRTAAATEDNYAVQNFTTVLFNGLLGTKRNGNLMV